MDRWIEVGPCNETGVVFRIRTLEPLGGTYKTLYYYVDNEEAQKILKEIQGALGATHRASR